MALQASVLSPAAANGVTATLAGTTATNAITVGKRVLLAISVSGVAGTSGASVNVTFGITTPTTPSSTVGFAIPLGTTQVFDLGSGLDSFMLFNASGATITYSYQQLSKF